MLSDDIQNLAEEFARLGEGPASFIIEPTANRAIVAMLNDFSSQAWNLERQQVSMPARISGYAGDGVDSGETSQHSGAGAAGGLRVIEGGRG